MPRAGKRGGLKEIMIDAYSIDTLRALAKYLQTHQSTIRQIRRDATARRIAAGTWDANMAEIAAIDLGRGVGAVDGIIAAYDATP